MNRKQRVVFVALMLGACAEGKEYSGLSFDIQSAPPVPVSVESDRIEIPVGIAVQVEVEPLSHGRHYSSEDLLTLRADDPDLMGVYAGQHDREFVLVGLREGSTCLEVKINRHQEDCIDVRVVSADK